MQSDFATVFYGLQVVKFIRSRKQIQAIVVNNTATHKSSLAVSAIPSQLWLVKRGDNCRGICSPAKRWTIRSRVHLRPGLLFGAA